MQIITIACGCSRSTDNKRKSVVPCENKMQIVVRHIGYVRVMTMHNIVPLFETDTIGDKYVYKTIDNSF